MRDQDNLLNPTTASNEKIHDQQLRPKSFAEYIGQKKVVANVEVMVQSSKLRAQAMDHLLLSGPPGLGKTSLANLIASELGVNLHVISGPAIEKKGDLAAILTNLEERDVLFIDEIHRLHVTVEEILYSAMEDYRLDIVIGEGPSARTMQIGIAHFTLIGATTRSGLLSNPLRDRFMAHLNYDFYSSEELTCILRNNTKKINMAFAEKALETMAKRARGTPRIANRILRRVRDFAVVAFEKEVSFESVNKALNLMEIDDLGLDRMDRKILSVIDQYYNGGPVGIDALCATLSEDRLTIEDVYEPYLLKEGFLIRSSRGRVISEKAKAHLVATNC